MTIQELADRAGVTTRTIRYYVEQGVLPPPERGRPAEYTEEHLDLLDLVRRLKDQYLPLEEIRDMLQRLTREQVEEFLGRSAPTQVEAHSQSSAADYVAQVLSRGALRSRLKEQAPPVPPSVYAPPASPSPNPAALPTRPVATRRSGEGSRASPGAANYDQQPAAAPATPVAASPYMNEERTWQRVTLAPGIELHYEASATAARTGLIRKLIDTARTILGSNQEKDTEEQR